jgi:hypothetical protein
MHQPGARGNQLASEIGVASAWAAPRYWGTKLCVCARADQGLLQALHILGIRNVGGGVPFRQSPSTRAIVVNRINDEYSMQYENMGLAKPVLGISYSGMAGILLPSRRRVRVPSHCANVPVCNLPVRNPSPGALLPPKSRRYFCRSSRGGAAATVMVPPCKTKKLSRKNRHTSPFQHRASEK